MECQNRGPWHLGITAEACENAGGRYFYLLYLWFTIAAQILTFDCSITGGFDHHVSH
jgi:hypothetical protein